jgi:hypothetical protein
MKAFHFVIFVSLFMGFACSNPSQKAKTASKELKTSVNEEGEWIQLFNGKNLDGWTIKFTGSPMNENYKNTFRVEDGLLKVVYDEYETFNGEFGHLFYNTPYSKYKLRIEYRFVGDQVKNGPGWAFKNSGAMLHSQAPESMELDQPFPVSIEAQLLGGDGTNDRPTANLCTPGTNVVLNGEFFTPHCTQSSSKTYHGDEWVTVEFIVLGDEAIHHLVEDEVVLTYTQPTIGGGNKPKDYPVADGTPLKEGFIALQAESHPVEFRKVELLVLE